MQIRKLEGNPGILPIKEGTALVSHDKWLVFKILDLKSIYEDLEISIRQSVELNRLVYSKCNETILSEINDTVIQMNYIKNITLERYKQLVPTFRYKRGLLNPLGSIIKIISGNLDNDDAIKYDNLINEVKIRQNGLQKKITLISEMVGILTDSTAVIKNNLIQLNNAVREINQQLDKINMYQIINRLTSVYNLFIHSFQSICIKLDEIETAVAFSRIGILHRSIVDTDELIKLLKSIERSEKLVYPCNSENIVKIEQTIGLKSYFKKYEITFVLEIPLIKKETYFYYRIVPFPITEPSSGQTLIIIPKYPYLIAKGLKAMPLAKPCQEVEDSTYLCNEKDTIIPVEDKCVTDLMKYSTNVSCTQINVEFNEVKVEPIQTNKWIVYSNKEIEIIRTCENEIIRYTIQGSYILTMDDKCEVKIGEYHLRQRQFEGKDINYEKTPFINFPKNISMAAVRTDIPVNLDDIRLSDLQTLRHMIKKKVEDSESVVKTSSVSLATLVLYAILIISILSFVLFKIRIKCIDRCHPPDDFALKGGEVKDAQRAELAGNVNTKQIL